MKKLIIYGAGGGGKGVLRIVEGINRVKEIYDVLCFVDDNEKLGNTSFLERKIFSRLTDIEYSSQNPLSISISIANPVVREKLYEVVTKMGFETPSLIHPSVDVDFHVKLGRACVIYPGSIVAPDVVIGDNVMINMGVVIGHDVSIGSNSVLSPGVNLGGYVDIGKKSFMGMACCIRQGIRIGTNSVVGMGSIVLRDVPDNVVVAGNPAKIIRYNTV